MNHLALLLKTILNDTTIHTFLFKPKPNGQQSLFAELNNYNIGTYSFANIRFQEDYDRKNINLEFDTSMPSPQLIAMENVDDCEWIALVSMREKRQKQRWILELCIANEIIQAYLILDAQKKIQSISFTNKLSVLPNNQIVTLEGIYHKEEANGVMMVTEILATAEETEQYHKRAAKLKKWNIAPKCNFVDELYQQKLQFVITKNDQYITCHITKSLYDQHIKSVYGATPSFYLKMEGNFYGENEFDCIEILQCSAI